MQDGQVWSGRVHLGDEPGVYGDALYMGFSVELPLRITRREEAGDEDPSIEVVVEVEHVQMTPEYEGHLLVLVGYEAGEDGRFQERMLGSKRITESGWTSMYYAPAHDAPMPEHVSVGVRIDTSRRPGLYDDFVVREISVRSLSFKASLGFA